MVKVDADGWTVVPAAKGAAKKEAFEKAAKEEAMKRMQEEAQKTSFSSLVKTKKKKEDAEEETAAAAQSPTKKKERTEEEKAAAKKALKKEKAAKMKAEEKAKQQTSPTARKVVSFGKVAATLPASLVEELAGLKDKFVNRTKDQFTVLVETLDDYLTPDCTTCDNFKSLSLEEKAALPLSLHTSNALQPIIQSIIDGSQDMHMWTAMIKNLLLNIFGRGCARVDEGRHYLGSRLALQVLLAHCGQAFASSSEGIEAIFQHDNADTMSAQAAVNYGWVLMQLSDDAAPAAVEAWARVYLKKMINNCGRDTSPLIETGCTLLDKLAALQPSQEARLAYRKATQSDPLSAAQMNSVLGLIAPKCSNRVLRIWKKIIPQYSILFSQISARNYFTKTAAGLKTANDISRPLLLDTLCECMVHDPWGTCTNWTSDILPLVKETAAILDHATKNQKALSTRLNGMEMEKFFERLAKKCADIKSGALVPEGKKAKQCDYEMADVDAVLAAVKRASGLVKAVPLDAPKTKKNQQTIVHAQAEKARRAATPGFFTYLFTFILTLVALSLITWLALPFLPKETASLITENALLAKAEATKHLSTIQAKVNQAIADFQKK